MAGNFEHIIHKHSATVTNGNPKLPVATDLELGELAVNYAKDNETISLKNTNDEIVTFSSDSQINEKFYTKEEIDDDHLVISSSLNDLNTRVISAENVIETVKVNGTALTPDASKAVDITVPSAVTVDSELNGTSENPVQNKVIYEGLSAKQNALTFDTVPTENSTNPVTSGGVYKFLSDDELVISSALNDLNTRASSLESRMSAAEDSIDTKQETLVSGTNIKTINNQSLLGEGNITIEGGSGGSGEANVIEVVKVNGTALTPDANKAVDITSVPSSIVTQDTTHRFVSDTEKTTWNGKQDALRYGELKGSLYRSNVSGTGNISINGTTGEFPTVTAEGTYIVVTEMSSATQSYGLNVTFGGDTYSLSTTDGKISDKREIVISSNKTWSASVTGSVAASTILSVKLYLVSGNVSVLGLVAVTDDYNDLLNKPTIPAAVTESTVSGWGFTKNAGTVTGVKMNGTTKSPSSGVVDLGTVITSHQDISGKANTADLATVATSGSYNDLSNKPTIPSAPGTLKTNNTTAQTASASESLSGTISLHKVAKTGTYSDLIGTPTIPSAPGTLTTTATAAQSTATNESLSGNIALHKVSKTGSYDDLNNKPTIPTVYNATITIKNGNTTLGTFTVNASSNVEIDISSALPIGVPTYTSADNGKILGVVNGSLTWITPTTIYTGSGTPSSSTGNDGDIYLQTS